MDIIQNGLTQCDIGDNITRTLKCQCGMDIMDEDMVSRFDPWNRYSS